MTSDIVDIGVALVATILIIVFAVVKGRNYGYHQQQRHRVQDHHVGEEVATDLEPAGAAEQLEDDGDASSIWSADDQEDEQLS